MGATMYVVTGSLSLSKISQAVLVIYSSSYQLHSKSFSPLMNMYYGNAFLRFKIPRLTSIWRRLTEFNNSMLPLFFLKFKEREGTKIMVTNTVSCARTTIFVMRLVLPYSHICQRSSFLLGLHMCFSGL